MIPLVMDKSDLHILQIIFVKHVEWFYSMNQKGFHILRVKYMLKMLSSLFKCTENSMKCLVGK